MDVMQEGGAVFPQTIDELTGQRGGELEELIRVEEWSHCGVQTNSMWMAVNKKKKNNNFVVLHRTGESLK